MELFHLEAWIIKGGTSLMVRGNHPKDVKKKKLQQILGYLATSTVDMVNIPLFFTAHTCQMQDF